MLTLTLFCSALGAETKEQIINLAKKKFDM